MAMEFVETPRPLTHDLIVNIIDETKGKLSSIKITGIEDGVYYAIIDIQNDKLGHIHVDSRPSDALAIALRTHTPILAAEEVMDEAIVWEEDSLILEDEIKNSPELEILEEQLQKAIDTNSLWENLVQLTDNLDDYSIFHQVINRNEKDNTMDILFVASKLTDINSYVSVSYTHLTLPTNREV